MPGIVGGRSGNGCREAKTGMFRIGRSQANTEMLGRG